MSCSDFDDSSVALNFIETVNEVTLSYIGITSLDFYTPEFHTYALITVGREDNAEDSSSIIIPCLLFSFSSFFFFSQYTLAGNWQHCKDNMNLQNQ